MPIYTYICSQNHENDIFRKRLLKRPRKRYRCKTCGLWAYRSYKNTVNKIVHLNRNTEPISHLASKRSFTGHVVENLTPEPVFVRDRKQYMDLLKRTHSREKGA